MSVTTFLKQVYHLTKLRSFEIICSDLPVFERNSRCISGAEICCSDALEGQWAQIDGWERICRATRSQGDSSRYLLCLSPALGAAIRQLSASTATWDLPCPQENMDRTQPGHPGPCLQFPPWATPWPPLWTNMLSQPQATLRDVPEAQWPPAAGLLVGAVGPQLVPHCLAPHSHSNFAPQQQLQGIWCSDCMEELMSLRLKSIRLSMRDSPQLILREEAIFLNVKTWSHMRSLRLCHPAFCTAPARHRLPTAPAGHLQPFHGMGHLWAPVPRKLHWALSVYMVKVKFLFGFRCLNVSVTDVAMGDKCLSPPSLPADL